MQVFGLLGEKSLNRRADPKSPCPSEALRSEESRSAQQGVITFFFLIFFLGLFFFFLFFILVLEAPKVVSRYARLRPSSGCPFFYMGF